MPILGCSSTFFPYPGFFNRLATKTPDRILEQHAYPRAPTHLSSPFLHKTSLVEETHSQTTKAVSSKIRAAPWEETLVAGSSSGNDETWSRLICLTSPSDAKACQTEPSAGPQNCGVHGQRRPFSGSSKRSWSGLPVISHKPCLVMMPNSAHVTPRSPRIHACQHHRIDT